MTLIEPTMIEVTAGNGVVVRMDPLAFYAEALSCGLRDGTGTEAEAANLAALEKALATVAPETAEWTRSAPRRRASSALEKTEIATAP